MLVGPLPSKGVRHPPMSSHPPSSLSHAWAAALGSDVSPRAGEAGEETAARGEPSGHGPRTRADRRTDGQTA